MSCKGLCYCGDCVNDRAKTRQYFDNEVERSEHLRTDLQAARVRINCLEQKLIQKDKLIKDRGKYAINLWKKACPYFDEKNRNQFCPIVLDLGEQKGPNMKPTFIIAWYCETTADMDIEVYRDCKTVRECLEKHTSNEEPEYFEEGESSARKIVESNLSDDDVFNKLADGGLHIMIRDLSDV